jgi:hypothetical protein
MATESDKKQQVVEKQGLTKRQLKVIPLLVTSLTYTEACEKASINRSTLYDWLKMPEFKAEVERLRSQIAEQAFGILTQNMTRAAETLAGLLDDSDKRLKRFAAKDIIEYVLKHKEIEDLQRRIDAIEDRLADQGRR